MKDLQMKGLTEKIGELLDKLGKSKRKELDLQDVAQRIKEFQIALDSAAIELRHIGNHPDKAELKQMLREHKNQLKELKIRYEERKGAIVKDELLGDHSEETDRLETAEGLMEHGLNTQAKSQESLQRTLATIERTKEVGTDVVLKLETNTKQIQNMYDELEQIESSLARSTKIIRRIGRKMATDRYIWVMIVLLLCAILVIIVLTKVNLHPGSGNDNSSSSSSTGTG